MQVSSCLSLFFLCNLKVNLAVTWIGMKISVKVTLESLHFKKLSMSPGWTTSLWSWRHPDGEMVVETVGLFVVYGNVFYSFPKQELLILFSGSSLTWLLCSSPQAWIWIRWADWSSPFPVWEKHYWWVGTDKLNSANALLAVKRRVVFLSSTKVEEWPVVLSLNTVILLVVHHMNSFSKLQTSSLNAS